MASFFNTGIKNGTIVNKKGMKNDVPISYNELKTVSIINCDKSALTDILSVKIDSYKSKPEKLFDYISQVKNPYLFRLGDLAVKVTFDDSGKSLQQKFESLILENLGR